MGEFNLHEELVRLQENDVLLDNEVDISRLDTDDISVKLDELIERLQGEPAQILDPVTFDGARSFVKHFDALDLEVAHKFVDFLLSVFLEQMKNVDLDLEENAQHNFEQDRACLQMYTFCWHWLLEVAETRWKNIKKEVDKAASMSSKPKPRAGKGRKVTTGQWDWPTQKGVFLATSIRLVSLDLNRLIIATSDRDTLLGMMTKSVSLMLEDPETVKDETVKGKVVELLCLCVTRYDRAMGHGLQTRVVEQYLREEHLSEFVAEFLEVLVTKHNDTKMTDAILRQCTAKEFSDKEPKLAKAFSRFLIRLSEIVPKEVLKQMVHLQIHFDSESYTVRMGMIEVVGNLIHNFLAANNSESAAQSLHSYYEILQDRFRDVSSYVRVKVLQVLMRLTERREGSALTDIPIATRPVIINLTAGRLHDKASNVRKNAIKLMAKYIETSPFIAIAHDDGRLSLTHFEEQQRNLEQIIKAKFPSEEIPGVEDISEQAEHGNEQVETETTNPNEPAVDATNPAGEQELRNLRGLIKYYKDGIRFVKQIEAATPVMCQLLASNAKGEVIEAMNFFVTAYQYQMECATIGVRQMVHKVWDKDAGESERMSVRDHLMKSYMAVYFETVPSGKRQCDLVAENFIKLTYTMTLAELTSLEQLITMLVASKAFDNETLDVLWGVFGSRKQSSRRRRGAIIILGMIGKAKKEVIAENLDNLLHDDFLLARYTCVALQQLGTAKRQKGSIASGHTRLPCDHPLFVRLKVLLLEPAQTMEWFGFAEQAINAIYLLSEHPDTTCGDVLIHFSARVLGIAQPADSDVDNMAAQMSKSLNIDEASTGPAQMQNVSSEPDGPISCDSLALAELCFIAGHVAIKQIVHLECVEAEWKRRKHIEEIAKTPRKLASGADELEQVTGTAEDEFTEGMAQVREQELLFGDVALLGAFGPLIAFICSNNRTFNHPVLQIMATLALCKFMCVSADFCEAHLQLLFTILEKAEDPIIRSNTIIGLGDMTICFNSLIDQNITYLYNRLNDTASTVKKNTLMVLTFLILNGMVKVKGQISEMAKCLEDKDSRISDLTKLFFTELSTKDNAVYNNLPDIISNLSHPETGVSEEQFRSIMKFLLDFIKKDKQTENIVEKLCLRFRNADTERQWRDISYCLSLLSFASEKSVKKLIEHYPQYQDKLHEPVVYKILEDIFNKAKKLAKPDTKSLIEDFEAKLQESHVKCVENETTVNNAGQARKDTTQRAPRHRKAADEAEQDIDDMFGVQTQRTQTDEMELDPIEETTDVESEDLAAAPPSRKAQAGRGRPRHQKPASSDESDEVEEAEENDQSKEPAQPTSAKWKEALKKIGRAIEDEDATEVEDEEGVEESSDEDDEGNSEEEEEEAEQEFETIIPSRKAAAHRRISLVKSLPKPAARR
ncbi:Condensin complex subunit [Thoreauomyces humboldtii]|nr:Condensin complex subunit [Thoreauomyces humboldtii]